jgi:hypothetical protein
MFARYHHLEGLMSEFKSGNYVITPSGRIAKVNRFWEEPWRDDYPRVDLTYADNGEQVRLSPALLKLYEDEQPGRRRRERKERNDVAVKPRRISVRLDDAPIPALDPIEQLLLMDGCMKIEMQGQAGGLASSKKRRLLH